MKKDEFSTIPKDIKYDIYDNSFYTTREYLKDVIGIKTDNKLDELLKVSGVNNNTNNKFDSNSITKIAEFIGGDNSKKLNKMAKDLQMYDAQLIDKNIFEFPENVIDEYDEMQTDADLLTRNEQLHLNTISFTIPTNYMMSYASNQFKSVNTYMNNARYYFSYCQNVISSSITLSLAHELDDDISNYLFKGLLEYLTNNNLKAEKYLDMASESTYLYNILLNLRKFVISKICEQDDITEYDLESVFRDKIMCNAFVLCTFNTPYIRVMYDAFCNAQFDYIMGKYAFTTH